MNCQNCKFNGDRGCAVNPSYWNACKAIEQSDEKFRDKILPFFETCPEWNEDPPETLSLTLGSAEWRFLLSSSGSYERRRQVGLRLFAEIRRATNWQPPKDGSEVDDIPF
ncbi:hypothetical protein H6F67_25345 [Microcoleus sp. FACHB-1515]|uniref:hypothetical protein n=1 Tax=Cyanophyceae TaxID=3028117 RepID=UPI0016895A43|nr:hypothetical protein [Microcoleus sp. FACHB-1515]MBD2093175.1 hypothetical protein [Microcoleus sp. FACHB-1515]